MLRFLCIVAAGGLLGSCQRPAPRATAAATACLDPARIDSTGICTTEYNPVYGCNGRTYPNPCAAGKAGVLAFKPGPCPAANRP